MVELIKKLAQALDKRNLPYMVIGGQAAMLYRSPRFTNDIDISIGINPDRLNELLKVIDEIKLKILTDNPIKFVMEKMILPTIDESGFRVDLILSQTQYEKDAIQRASVVDVQGIRVRYAIAEDIIIHKIFAGREIDLEDVRMIMISNKNLDIELIKGTLKQLGEYTSIDFISRFNNIG
ncbi:MAG: hypothetical protein EPN82_15295 [Bacteroidetes bacterium]|nr:MAG: hypothetical protein EPN82_15295 [Bacteroidota bacterium]